MEALFYGLLGGWISWLTAEAVAEPLRWFSRTRREVRVELKELSRWWPLRDTTTVSSASFDEHFRKTEIARQRLGQFGQQFAAMTDVLPPAVRWWLVRVCGYKLMQAGAGLTQLAGSLHTSDEHERFEAERLIADALRFTSLTRKA